MEKANNTLVDEIIREQAYQSVETNVVEIGCDIKRGNREINNLKDNLLGELTKTKVVNLLIYFSILSVLEILAYQFQGMFSMIASRSWMLIGLGCFVGILSSFVNNLWQDLKESKLLSIVAVLSLVIVLVYFVGNVNLSEINPDAAQQVAAGLTSFQSVDFNYTGKAFLDYPIRQYLIAALPAQLLGRSIFTLQMGFALPFILGIILLYCALRKWLQKLKLNTAIAVLPLFALFVFPYVTEYYVNFEQAIYPISFTMLGIGFFLLFISEPNVINTIGLAWAGCMFSNSYTPVLASLGLFIVFLACISFLWLKKPEKMPFVVPSPKLAAISALLVEMNVIVFLFASFIDEHQNRMTEVRPDIKIVKTSYKSIVDFLTDQNATFLGMFGIIVIIYLLASLTLQLKFRDFLVALWILGVFLASNLLTGYTIYDPAWVMQRALIVIPVMITAIALTAFDYLIKNKIKLKRGMILVMIISFSFLGIHNFKQINQSFLYFNQIQPMKYMWEDLENMVKEQGLKATSKFNLVLYTNNILMKNPADYCKFFYPNAIVYVPEQGIYPEDMDASLDTFIYGDKGFPSSILIKPDYAIFEDAKHDLSILWFKAVKEAGTD